MLTAWIVLVVTIVLNLDKPTSLAFAHLVTFAPMAPQPQHPLALEETFVLLVTFVLR